MLWRIPNARVYWLLNDRSEPLLIHDLIQGSEDNEDSEEQPIW